MNECKTAGHHKKAQVLNRIIEASELLFERGYNATFIETEDIHTHRRSIDEIYNGKLRHYASVISRKEKYFPPEMEETVDLIISKLLHC
jgi:hypothetical protein